MAKKPVDEYINEERFEDCEIPWHVCWVDYSVVYSSSEESQEEMLNRLERQEVQEYLRKVKS